MASTRSQPTSSRISGKIWGGSVRKSKVLSRLGVIAIACATLAGLAIILQHHAQQADSFPTFSSFRTLPEGTSILYQALARTPGITAERNVRPLGTLSLTGAALLMLGIPLESLGSNGQWFSDMEELAAKGNRLVIALIPHRHRFLQTDPKELANTLKHWSVTPAFVRETDIRDDEEQKLMAGWPMYFATASGWEITRKENGRAVVIERAQGKGRLIVIANPYLLSNAAMVDDRQTAFLASLLGPARLAVFDETHFGIEQTGSIAGLARRYRLQGFLLGLIITASLFIWRSAAGFPPPPPFSRAQSVLGEDSAAAFLNLLRRNIKSEDILSTCVEAWRKLNQRKAGPNLATAIDLAEAGRKTPAATYARIQQLLSSASNGARHTTP